MLSKYERIELAKSIRLVHQYNHAATLGEWRTVELHRPMWFITFATTSDLLWRGGWKW